jgi:hypothetical protein
MAQPNREEPGLPATATMGDPVVDLILEEQQRRLDNAGRTPPPQLRTIDERLAEARARHAELLKERELHQLQAEIDELESRDQDDEGTTFTPEPQLSERTTPARSNAPDEYERPAAELQPEKLQPYNGKGVREHRDWTRAAENAFRLAPRKFRRDSARIAWSAQFLRGTPATTWQNIAAEEDMDLYSWNAFKQMLLDLIEDPRNRQLDAAQAYADAKQRPNQTAQEFNQYLLTLESQLSVEYTPEMGRLHLWTKLLESTRTAILNYQDIPTTRDGLVSLAMRIEKTPSHKRNLSTPYGSNDNKKSRSRDDRSTQSQRQGRASNTKPRDSIGKSKQDLSHITCFKCGDKGHFATTCTKSSPTVNSLQESQQDAWIKKEGKGQSSNLNPRRVGAKTS